MNRSYCPHTLLLCLLAGAAAIIASCSSDTPAQSRLAMLTGGSSKTWRMTSDSSYTGLASNPCLFDNDYVFDTAGNFINRDNGVLCDSSEERELRAQWTFDNDSTTLSFGPGTKLHITQLTDTMMVIEELAPPEGVPARRSVFVAKE